MIWDFSYWYGVYSFITTFNDFLGITDDVQAILHLPQIFAGIIQNFFLLAFYPVVVLVDIIQYLAASFINPIINIINAVISTGNALGSMTNVFSGTFPLEWVALMGIIILVNLAFRIYYFVRNIQIAGFSV